MKFSLLIQSVPDQQPGHAVQLAKALCASEHQLEGVFFQASGVAWADQRCDHPQAREMSQLAEDYAIPLILCSASAASAGLSQDRVRQGYEIAGLGRWIELLDGSDRWVQLPDPGAGGRRA